MQKNNALKSNACNNFISNRSIIYPTVYLNNHSLYP